ncbi:DNA-directed RNA polymerase subunit beta [Paenibacillus nasutitermitis]|uniref:DNA-directed RNA polymerase subunit beta n=1 Tax=Paenibacillus nasutitermitis TaxID=1652958 RepID=A0A916ZEH7_9BACL|nr:DNA-directed RNA polymerase subunit beta [Paenibacillus nasutitermitis]GGD92487.1 hypothetical protein GCM10010911_58880 [Paenibacillus nasutitermitis]
METKKIADGISQSERLSLLKPPVRNENPAARGPEKSQPDMQEEGKDREAAQTKRHPMLRVLLWCLRKSIVPILCVLAILGGMYIGYVMLGHRPSSDVFMWDTWKHMYDLIFADS